MMLDKMLYPKKIFIFVRKCLSRISLSCGYFLNLKKSTAEACNGAALSERNCRECFYKFRNGKLEDKKRSGRLKVYEDIELEQLLKKDSLQIQEKLALMLVGSQQVILYSLIVRNDSKARKLLVMKN